MGMYMNSRMELSKTSNAPDTVFSHCALAVSSFSSLTLRNKSKVSVLKTKVFVSGSILLLYLKRSWVCDKPYLHFVNLEGAYEEKLKAAWDSSTPYEKKTKGWQQGTHAAMFSWAKDGNKSKTKILEKHVARWASPAFPPVRLENETGTKEETTFGIILHEVMLVM